MVFFSLVVATLSPPPKYLCCMSRSATLPLHLCIFFSASLYLRFSFSLSSFSLTNGGTVDAAGLFHASIHPFFQRSLIQFLVIICLKLNKKKESQFFLLLLLLRTASVVVFAVFAVMNFLKPHYNNDEKRRKKLFYLRCPGIFFAFGIFMQSACINTYTCIYFIETHT